MTEEVDVENLIVLDKDDEAIYDASRCERRNRDYIGRAWLETALQMGVGKRSASGCVAYFDDDNDDDNKSNNNPNNSILLLLFQAYI